ncbi:MAG: beta-mannosidase, partial [Bacteroidota bacterium]
TNFWYGMNLGSEGAGGDRKRLIRELDHLKSIGINNLRIMAASEGDAQAPWRMQPSLQPNPAEYDDALWEGLDFLLTEMRKRELYAVV